MDTARLIFLFSLLQPTATTPQPTVNPTAPLQNACSHTLVKSIAYRKPPLIISPTDAQPKGNWSKENHKENHPSFRDSYQNSTTVLEPVEAVPVPVAFKAND
ncbi:hypothetical protein K432DRAFT_385770 [Lepidopterella palustris CBS 459.81]|uniref:Uncharacterized protein n=1 Tax=Lepidopterella palustris CBS 459.81 TaxID=1314670 RepID=A0A8E2E2J3_9PEZI|nr:hypothetical protein K432DRAFT_385770 [Lepidopterella palustris CBS 459.81]